MDAIFDEYLSPRNERVDLRAGSVVFKNTLLARNFFACHLPARPVSNARL